MDRGKPNPAETLLRESEVLLRRAQRMAKLGHWISTVTIQPDGSSTSITRYGAAAAEILGRPIEELDGSDEDFIRNFVHPDDRATCLRLASEYVKELAALQGASAKP